MKFFTWLIDDWYPFVIKSMLSISNNVHLKITRILRKTIMFFYSVTTRFREQTSQQIGSPYSKPWHTGLLFKKIQLSWLVLKFYILTIWLKRFTEKNILMFCFSYKYLLTGVNFSFSVQWWCKFCFVDRIVGRILCSSSSFPYDTKFIWSQGL